MDQPGYKEIKTYLAASLPKLHSELLNRFLDPKGRDISDILRGKILMLMEILSLEQLIKDFKIEQKGAE